MIPQTLHFSACFYKFTKMKILQIIILLIAFLSMGYAVTRPLTFEAEKSNNLQGQTRQKRGLLLAKAGLLGGALLAKKALLLGTGAGLIGGGLAGAGIYTLKSQLLSGYRGGCGYPGGFMGGCGSARISSPVNPQVGMYGGHLGFDTRFYPQPIDNCDPPCIPRAPVRCCS